jgi:hypothetical protein
MGVTLLDFPTIKENKTMKKLLFFLVVLIPFTHFSQCILELNVTDLKEIKKNKAVDNKDTFHLYLRNECRQDYLFFINDELYHSGPIEEYSSNGTNEKYVVSGHKFKMDIIIDSNSITLIEHNKQRKKVFKSEHFDRVRSGY